MEQKEKTKEEFIEEIKLLQKRIAEFELLGLEDLEFRVRQRTEQLEIVNRDLEAFSYLVSHDLRAPLRGISGFSLALDEEYSEKLDDQARHYIKNIRDSATRMAQLIEDMLRLSRISRVILEKSVVDLSALASAILEELRSSEPMRDVEYAVDPGLKTTGDNNFLRIVLDNLLKNAWKFTRNNPHACIKFAMIEQRDEKIFYVQDNGIGFDMAYIEKLFEPFQRLHSEEEFKGTGLGLAIVKRIINCHFGRIWAESRVGEGATFYFSLPK